MELPKISLPDSSVFDSVKSKLGIGNRDNYEEYNDEYDDEYAEDYEDGYVDDYYDYSDKYGTYDDYESNGKHAAKKSTGYDSFPYETKPSLVSIEDVRENPGPRPTEGAYSSRQSQTAQSGYTFNGVASTIGTSVNFPEKRKSEGLDSLFGSPVPQNSNGNTAPSSIWDAQAPNTSDFASKPSAYNQASSAPYNQQPTTRQSYDPYDAYAGNGASFRSPTRAIIVLKPSAYADVERIAKTVRTGDVIILALRNTPDSLSKRVLDFSFGVASALSARVDCIADKVFAINCGDALTPSELTNLRNQGVL
jgi:FtsZ-interacting cell division protein YlmF